MFHRYRVKSLKVSVPELNYHVFHTPAFCVRLNNLSQLQVVRDPKRKTTLPFWQRLLHLKVLTVSLYKLLSLTTSISTGDQHTVHTTAHLRHPFRETMPFKPVYLRHQVLRSTSHSYKMLHQTRSDTCLTRPRRCGRKEVRLPLHI